MCGITGFTGRANRRLLNEMTALVAHRGPDGAGIYEADGVNLGHRRLSIIDFSTGDQPMSSEDGAIVVAYNGEIFNYIELTSLLNGRGHTFRTKSDTEVIIHAYEEFGMDFMHRLNGMFAIALWDKRENKLVLVRDRVGVKPLYYAMAGGELYFASEYKCLLLNGIASPFVNNEALKDYFATRYTPGEVTMVAGIKKLLPGHCMVWREGRVLSHRYWKVDPYTKVSLRFDEAVTRYNDLFSNAVMLRMRSDVPISLTLSGGIDSNAILAKMVKYTDEPINTFTFCFEGFSHDEKRAAASSATLFNTNHQNIFYEAGDISNILKVIWHYDDPWGDATMVPWHLLNRQIKKYATVQLTGAGADEVLSGYVHHRALYWGNMLNKLLPPSRIANSVLAFAAKNMSMGLIQKLFHHPSPLGKKGKDRLIAYLLNRSSDAKTFRMFSSLFTADELRGLIHKDRYVEETSYDLGVQEIFDVQRGRDMMDRIFEHEIKYYLPEMACRGLDRQTMASGVEARVPFLDYRLIEFVASLPSSYRINMRQNKILLREALKNDLPPDNIRRRKQGFHMPLENYFKGNEFQQLLKDSLSEGRILRKGFFNSAFVASLVKEYDRSPFVVSKQVWALLVFDIWHSMYIEKSLSA